MVALSAIAALFLHTLALLLALATVRYTRTLAPGLAVVALAAALIGASVRRPCRYNAAASRLVPSLLCLAVVVNFAGLLLLLAALHAILNRPYWVTFGVAVLAVPALASYSRIPLMPPRLRFPWILAVTLLLGGLMIRAEPEPYIDLWYMQQRACGLLLLGENPYAALYPNIYPDEGHYGAAVLEGPLLHPFVLLPAPEHPAGPPGLLPGWRRALELTRRHRRGGDPFLVAAGRRLGLPAGSWAELGVALLLLHPMTPVVVLRRVDRAVRGTRGRAWRVGAGLRTGPGPGPVAGLGRLSQQYGFLWVASVWSTGRVGRRDALLGAAAAAAVLLPLALADPALFWLGNVTHHLVSPPIRTSCRCRLSSGRRRATTPRPPRGSRRRWRLRGPLCGHRPALPSRAALGGGAILLTFFLLNKVANINFHWLVMSFFALAVVSAIGEERGAGALDLEANPSE